MEPTRTIHVRLPAGADITAEDLELLDATFHAIVTLRYQGGHDWERLEQDLEASGWDIRARLMWVAEARRGRDCEQAIGRTKDEAFGHLEQLTRLYELPHVP